MTFKRNNILLFEKRLEANYPDYPEELKSETKHLIIEYQKEYEVFEQRRNRYQRRLMGNKANEWI